MVAAPPVKPKLLVLGLHKASEGYPNVKYRVSDLYRCAAFDAREINFPVWSEKLHLNRPAALLLQLFLSLGPHIRLLAGLARSPKVELIYVPYPAVSVLAMLALMPRRFVRAPIVMDAFISWYDSAVNDRKLLNSGNLAARLLHAVETMAYQRADRVIVDTPENAHYLTQEFKLPQGKVRAIPLSTNELDYQPVDYLPNPSRVRVLFIGTFVPLQGVATIVEAAIQLRRHTAIEFRLIGNGQEAPRVERLLSDAPANLLWIRDWATPSDLAGEIAQADICLGIFGPGEKGQRVCPLKIYAYARVGRAIITGDTEWLRNATDDRAESIFAHVPVNDPRALAEKIAALAKNPSLRSSMALASQKFYREHLTNDIAMDKLLDCLEGALRA